MDSWCEHVARTGAGLHTLLREPDHLGAFAERCERILACLDPLLEHTRAAAPGRTRDFCLLRPASEAAPGRDTAARRGEEAAWERAMWATWGPHGGPSNFLPDCPRLQTYQFPLQRVRADGGWGKVDLLGVGPDRRPVVVELKRPGSRDTVLHMLLEMAAYGVALRVAWPTLMEPEWEMAMRTAWGARGPDTADLGRLTLIGAAPPAYWARVRGADPRDVAGRVPASAWPPFCELVAELGRRGDFAIRFAVVHAADGDPNGHLAGGRERPRAWSAPTPVRAALIDLCAGPSA